MAYVVCPPCVKCQEMNCLEVCPVAAFHEGPHHLVIDPAVCIDCGACSVECPYQAIFSDDEIPAHWENCKDFNALHARTWPIITESKGIKRCDGR